MKSNQHLITDHFMGYSRKIRKTNRKNLQGDKYIKVMKYNKIKSGLVLSIKNWSNCKTYF